MNYKSVSMRIEGYWYSPSEPALPMPLAQNKPWVIETDEDQVFSQEAFLTILNELEKRIESEKIGTLISYRGWATCRLCGIHNGSQEFELRGQHYLWRWPVGLSHYIEKHNVMPSPDFVKFIVAAYLGG